MILYHTSEIQGLKTLEPKYNKQKDSNHINENNLYFSPNKKFSACFGCKWRSNGSNPTGDLGFNNGKMYFKLSPKIDQSKPCSIYTVKTDNYEMINKYEAIVKEPVKVQKEEKFNSFSEMMKRLGIKVENISESTIINELPKNKGGIKLDNKAKYESIANSIQDKYDNGIITYEQANELNDLAYNKYMTEDKKADKKDK